MHDAGMRRTRTLMVLGAAVFLAAACATARTGDPARDFGW